MSHLTTSANTKTDAGAPGLTGTSPGQDIGTDEVQDQSKTHKEPKHSNGHVDKSTESESSATHHKRHHEEKHSKSDSKDLLDTPSEPVRAGTPTATGAPGATGASPMEPFGVDESRNESPKVHDHHKHHDNSKKKESFSSEKNSSSASKPSTESKTATESKPSTDSKSSEDEEANRDVTASTKTSAGAVGPTGTGPMEPVGSDESRDDSPKTHVHHKHDSHHYAETKSPEVKSECTPITMNKAIPDDTNTGDKSSKAEGDGISSKAILDGEGTTSSDKISSSTKESSNSTKDSSSTTMKSDGEFDGPNASFASEIGSKEDPGRVAEKKMHAQNAQHGDIGSMGMKQDSITGGGQFDVLNSEEAA